MDPRVTGKIQAKKRILRHKKDVKCAFRMEDLIVVGLRSQFKWRRSPG